MEMENMIGLTDLLAAAIRAWKQICVTMLVFALLLGGYQGYRQYKLATDPENSPEKIEERYQAALEDYEKRGEELQKKLEGQEESLASKEEYREESLLIKIDPYNKYITNIVFSFSNIDESAQLFRYPNTAADYLPKKIRSQYLELWKSMDVPRDLADGRYADLEWKYLNELISIPALEGELLSIRTMGASAKDAEDLAGAIFAYFDGHRDAIGRSSAAHELSILNQSTKCVIDEELKTKQESLDKEIEDLKTGIEDTKQSIEDLTEPEREDGYSVMAIVKSVAKYVALGAAGGLFLACFLVCCWWIFADRAANSFQLERSVGAPFLGAMKPSCPPAERLAAAVMGERRWRDPEQASAYIREQAEAGFPKEGKVLLLSTLPEGKAGAGMAGLASALEGYAVTSVLDALHDPKAVKAIQDCAAAVFVEMAGQSRLTDIRDLAAQVEGAKRPVLGVIAI